MPTNILMPALSPTMEKGNLARWLKKEGDKIKSGDVIAEIETDKATMEYEAVDEGTLAKIVVPEGTQDVAVNAVIAVLAAEGEDVKAAVRPRKNCCAGPRSRKATKPRAPRPNACHRLTPSAPPDQRRFRPPERTAFSPPRSRAAWRKTPASISIACRAPARMAA